MKRNEGYIHDKELEWGTGEVKKGRNSPKRGGKGEVKFVLMRMGSE